MSVTVEGLLPWAFSYHYMYNKSYNSISLNQNHLFLSLNQAVKPKYFFESTVKKQFFFSLFIFVLYEPEIDVKLVSFEGLVFHPTSVTDSDNNGSIKLNKEIVVSSEHVIMNIMRPLTGVMTCTLSHPNTILILVSLF